MTATTTTPMMEMAVTTDAVLRPSRASQTTTEAVQAAAAAEAAADRANAAAGSIQGAVDASAAAAGSALAAQNAANTVRGAYRKTLNRMTGGVVLLQVFRDAANRALLGLGANGRIYQFTGGGAESIMTRSEVGTGIANARDKRVLSAPFRATQNIRWWLPFREAATKRVIAGIDTDGRFWESAGGGKFQRPGGSLAGVADRTTLHDATSGCSVPANCTTRIAWWLGWGQSLDVSGNADDPHVVYTSTALHPGRVFMLNTGMAPYYSTGTTTGIVDAYDQVTIVAGQTGLLSFLNRLYTLINTATGVQPLLGGSIQAAGGTAIANLRRGTLVYEQILKNVVVARDAAKAKGLGFYVPGIRTLHGNEDTGLGTTREQYYRLIEQLQYDLDADIRAITGQVEPVLIYWGQPDTGFVTPATEAGPVQAILDAGRRHPFVHALPAHYDLPRDTANSVHPSALGYMYGGERDAETVFADLYCNGRRPFAPVAAWFSSPTSIDVEFYVPVEPLVLDISDAIVKTAGLDYGRGANGYGFEFDDGSGAPPYVTGVTILPPRVARVTLSAAPTGGRKRLFYAMRKTSQDGPVGGARGCLRDSSPATASYDGRALQNWAARFVQTL
jgi:hypothetical protein